jgi:hypothetical protein
VKRHLGHIIMGGKAEWDYSLPHPRNDSSTSGSDSGWGSDRTSATRPRGNISAASWLSGGASASESEHG